jgi:hypothetical protein
MRTWRKDGAGEVVASSPPPAPYVAGVVHPAGLDVPFRFAPRPMSEALAYALDNAHDDGYNERGLGGGGQCIIRKTQRTTPRKGNTWRGKQAHRMPYGPKRTW